MCLPPSSDGATAFPASPRRNPVCRPPGPRAPGKAAASSLFRKSRPCAGLAVWAGRDGRVRGSAGPAPALSSLECWRMVKSVARSGLWSSSRGNWQHLEALGCHSWGAELDPVGGERPEDLAEPPKQCRVTGSPQSTGPSDPFVSSATERLAFVIAGARSVSCLPGLLS